MSSDLFINILFIWAFYLEELATMIVMFVLFRYNPRHYRREIHGTAIAISIIYINVLFTFELEHYIAELIVIAFQTLVLARILNLFTLGSFIIVTTGYLTKEIFKAIFSYILVTFHCISEKAIFFESIPSSIVLQLIVFTILTPLFLYMYKKGIGFSGEEPRDKKSARFGIQILAFINMAVTCYLLVQHDYIHNDGFLHLSHILFGILTYAFAMYLLYLYCQDEVTNKFKNVIDCLKNRN